MKRLILTISMMLFSISLLVFGSAYAGTQDGENSQGSTKLKTGDAFTAMQSKTDLSGHTAQYLGGCPPIAADGQPANTQVCTEKTPSNCTVARGCNRADVDGSNGTKLQSSAGKTGEATSTSSSESNSK